MCGRFASYTPPSAIRSIFRTGPLLPNIGARYNVAPTLDVMVVRFNSATGERSLDLLQWGLVPHWAKDPSIANKLINARTEGIDSKPSFRDAFQRRRGLIPVDAFYEWKTGTKPKQPFVIRRVDHEVMAFAGLWEGWKDPDGNWLKTTTIITTSANELVAPLHDRMPVILPPETWARWLGEEPASGDDLLAMLRPYPADQIEVHPVGFEVSNVRNEGAHLMEPTGARQQ